MKIFLIVDGHPTHRSKLVKEHLKKLKERLQLFFLPPYSPELNPDELVWNVLKNEVGRSSLKGPDDLQNKIISIMSRLQKFPDKIKSFYKEKHVQYAM
jgi:transposase